MDLFLEMSTNHGEATTLRLILISGKLSPLKLFYFPSYQLRIILCNYEEVYKESLTRYFHDDPEHISRYMLHITSLATIRLLVE
jgi:hypothetical protein